MKDTQTLLNNIINIAHEAGKIILNANRDNIGIQDKAGKANFVTKYDQKVQEVLQEELLKILPEAAFFGEEGDRDVDDSKEYIFVVDPIDGTTNFIKDYHHSCISIGLLKSKKRFIGVVYNPYLDETFYAINGEGAYLNNKQIHVTNEPIENALVLFGTSPYNITLAKASFDLAFEYFTKSLDIRRSGSAALDLCAVACGRAEVFFEMQLSPWDFAAGALIVKEAGGIVTTIDKKELPVLAKSSVLATNNKC